MKFLQDENQGDLQCYIRQNSTSPPCAATSDHYVWSPKNTIGGKYGFGCSELEGNACADYGIVITVFDDANRTIDSIDNVCEDGVVHEGDLLPGHSVMVGMWFTHRHTFHAISWIHHSLKDFLRLDAEK